MLIRPLQPLRLAHLMLVVHTYRSSLRPTCRNADANGQNRSLAVLAMPDTFKQSGSHGPLQPGTAHGPGITPLNLNHIHVQ